ncbi:MAG: hypothetical protein HY078_02835 [Elusimicrobia bacterium]|nr:hypothetical protein [Elusimicrobiota bacterium]
MNKKQAAASFINVDLEIRSRFDLKPLSDALTKSYVLNPTSSWREGRAYCASFSPLVIDGQPRQDPNTLILKMARAILRLPRSTRRHLNQAQDRVFDLGFEETKGGGTLFQDILLPETARLVSDLRARIAVTIYPRIRRPGH